jgi:hypothetical protein
MATLISKADGNFTSSSTWYTISAGASSSQTTKSASTATTTSNVYSSTFTLTNGDTVSGFLLYLNRSSTTGTFTVAVSANSGSTELTSQTVNCSDLPANPSWVFFYLPVNATGASTYCVGVRSSSAGTVTVFRNSTAGNWTRVPRLSTTATPGAADVLYIVGEFDSGNAWNARTVTMDSTATTAYGAMEIGAGGLLSYGTSASTNYYLRVAGDLNIWGNGELRIGNSGTPIPSSSTAVLEFNAGSAAQYGLIVNDGATFTTYGATKTVGCMLAADRASGGATITTDVSTSWKSGDVIEVASTTRTNTQTEQKTLSGDASGTSVTVTSNFSNTHSGTGRTAAEVINLTRNVKVRGISTSSTYYVTTTAASAWSTYYTEFYWCGSTTTAKKGIAVATTTGSFNMRYCSLHTWNSNAGSICIEANAASMANLTLTSNVFDGDSAQPASNLLSSTSTNNFQSSSITGNYFVNGGATLCFASGNSAAVDSNRFISGGTVAIQAASLFSFSGNVIHSCSAGATWNGLGNTLLDLSGAWFQGLSHWFNGGGFQFTNTTNAGVVMTGTIYNCTFFGNTSNNFTFKLPAYDLLIDTCTFDSDGSFSTTSGIDTGSGFCGKNITFRNCNFGNGTSLSYLLNATSNTCLDMLFDDCVVGVSTGVAQTFASTADGSVLRFQRYNQSTGDHRAYYPMGNVKTDTVIYNSASPSERATPSSSTKKLKSGSKFVSVNSGSTATISCYVRYSKNTDSGGANYGGNAPRLVLKRNDAAGITSDTVLATHSGSANWVQLSGTTASVADDCILEVYVDCDGTAGWVNIDDWSVS